MSAKGKQLKEISTSSSAAFIFKILN